MFSFLNQIHWSLSVVLPIVTIVVIVAIVAIVVAVAVVAHAAVVTTVVAAMIDRHKGRKKLRQH